MTAGPVTSDSPATKHRRETNEHDPARAAVARLELSRGPNLPLPVRRQGCGHSHGQLYMVIPQNRTASR